MGHFVFGFAFGLIHEFDYSLEVCRAHLWVGSLSVGHIIHISATRSNYLSKYKP